MTKLSPCETVAACPAACQLPIRFSARNGVLRDQLKELFLTYEEWLNEQVEQFSCFWEKIGLDSDEVIPFVEGLSGVIVRVLQLSHEGKRFLAMHHFWAFINKYHTLFLEKSGSREPSGFFPYCSLRSEDLPESLYRFRLSGDGLECSTTGLFHIPYGEKARIKRQRFSIEGVPFIYLGESLYACWKDMGEPSLDESSVSRYTLTLPAVNEYNEPVDNYLLNLAFDFRMVPFFHSENEESEDSGEVSEKLTHPVYSDDKQIAYHLIMRPLVMACSIARELKNGDFNEEHLMSNILLELLYQRHDLPGSVNRQPGSKGVIGVRYYSSHSYYGRFWDEQFRRGDLTAKELLRYERAFVNYALVAYPSDEQESGEQFSSIMRNSCELTRPLSWRELATFTPIDTTETLPQDTPWSTPEEAVLSRYELSQFGRFENTLDRFSTCRVEAL